MLFPAPDTPSQVWPVSVSGWFTMVAASVAVVGLPIAYGKWINRVNGFGERLAVVERKQAEAEGADAERVRALDRLSSQMASISEAIGRAEKSSETCREEADQHALAMGSRLADVVKELGTMGLTVSNRLTALETVAKLRGPT